MGLEDVFTTLRKNLYNPLIFYIPTSLIPEGKIDDFDKQFIEKFFDKVAILDSKFQLYEVTSSTSLFEVLTKPNLLIKNIFILTDQKTLLTSFQFEVLMDSYLQDLYFYVTISEWMSLHFSEFRSLKKEAEVYFQFQNNFFQNHLSEITSKFQVKNKVWQKPINISNYIYESKSTIEDLIRKQDNTKENVKIPSKRVKPILITDKEARNFLLKTVFNEDN